MGNCFDDEKPRKEIVAQKISEDSKNKKGSSNKNDNNKKNRTQLKQIKITITLKHIKTTITIKENN